VLEKPMNRFMEICDLQSFVNFILPPQENLGTCYVHQIPSQEQGISIWQYMKVSCTLTCRRGQNWMFKLKADAIHGKSIKASRGAAAG
jgi:hypothetical protein